jgi:hypothetical protein
MVQTNFTSADMPNNKPAAKKPAVKTQASAPASAPAKKSQPKKKYMSEHKGGDGWLLIISLSGLIITIMYLLVTGENP